MAANSFEAACLQEGYSLTSPELRRLSGLELPCLPNQPAGSMQACAGPVQVK